MSFSSQVKEELLGQISASRHCQLAELAACLCCFGRCKKDHSGDVSLGLYTENLHVIRKSFTLLEKTFNIDTGIERQSNADSARQHTYIPLLSGEAQTMRLLQAVKMEEIEATVNPLLIKNACCKRAFLRGAFLCIGSMSDPEKSYHLEFVCNSEEQAKQLQEIMFGFQIEAKIVMRKKYYVVYLKEGSCIALLLNVMEAHLAMMEFENYRILKEMRNSINRKVNCETANITKTVNASTKQIEDILLIRDTFGFQKLQDSLREMAQIRLEYPDATLKELGQMLNPPVGKSGVNHRLRKLSELADRMKV